MARAQHIDPPGTGGARRACSAVWMLKRLLPMVAAAVLPLAAVAQAAPEWSRPTAISSTTCHGGYTSDLQAAQNARGEVLVAWVEQCRQNLHPVRIVVAMHGSGQPVRRLLTLDRLDSSAQLTVALAANGSAIVAWSTESSVKVATRPPGERFGPARLLDQLGGGVALAANEAGDALLAWRHRASFLPDSDSHVVVASRAAGTRRFGPARTLSDPLAQIPNGFGSAVDVAPLPTASIAPDGTAAVAWVRVQPGANSCCAAIEAAIRQPGERHFGDAARVSLPAAPSAVLKPTIDVAGRDRALVAWTGDDASRVPGVQAARWNGQGFDTPVTIQNAAGRVGVFYLDPQILHADDGATTVTWMERTEDCPLGNRSWAASVLATGVPGEPGALTPPGLRLSGFATALDEGGGPISAWFEATDIVYGKYNACVPRATRLGGAVGGAPIAGGGKLRQQPGDPVLAAAHGRAPLLVWGVVGRVVATRLRGS